MLWIVLPVATARAAGAAPTGLIRRPIAAIYRVAAVDIGIAIEIIIVVNRDVVVAAPTAAISPTSAPSSAHG